MSEPFSAGSVLDGAGCWLLAVGSWPKAKSQEPIAIGVRDQSGVRLVRVALLGCGTVGSEVARHLVSRREEFRGRFGLDFDLVGTLVRDRNRNRGVDPAILTTVFDEVIESRPDVVVEVLGGLNPAAAYIRRCLEAGISVVTANKTVIAHRGAELRDLARRRRAGFAYEAAVAAALPVFASLRQYHADRITSIQGILNGSTNYLLSRMHESGLSIQDALAEARERGLIEPDPSADLSGRDAAEKLCILAPHAGLGTVRYDDIHISGIEHISADDVLCARRLGYRIRLVAELERTTRGVSARVGPALLPASHRLARVELERNGIVINSLLGGELYLEGAGAGPGPTAAAILSDLLRVVRGDPCQAGQEPRLQSPTNLTGSGRDQPSRNAARFFLRINRRITRTASEDGSSPERDRLIDPEDLFEALRRHRVSVHRVEVSTDAARVLTHQTDAESIEIALDELGLENPSNSIVITVHESSCRRSTSRKPDAADFPLIDVNRGMPIRRIA